MCIHTYPRHPYTTTQLNSNNTILCPPPLRITLNSNAAEAADKPTPLYNALIGRDLVYRENLMNIHANIRKGHVIKDAIRLLKVWIHQRQFNTVSSTVTTIAPLYPAIKLLPVIYD